MGRSDLQLVLVVMILFPVAFIMGIITNKDIVEPETETVIEYVEVSKYDEGYVEHLENELAEYKEQHARVLCSWNYGTSENTAVINSNTNLPKLPNLGVEIKKDCEGVEVYANNR